MIVRPADSLLAGEYELDDFSYSRVDNTNAYHYTPILLTIHSNGSFDAANLPDMVFSPTGRPVIGQLLNAKGSWSIPADKPSPGGGFVPFSGNILFQFPADNSSHATLTLTNQLTLRANQPAILIPVGAPDSHQRLLFVKKE